MKHIKAFTYKDKIPDVKAGRCCQTIRPRGKKPVIEGDQILFHGWAGKPYRSRWDWRLTITVNMTMDIWVFNWGITYQAPDAYVRLPKRWFELRDLAVLDGIRARFPYAHAGVVLGELLNGMYKLEHNGPGAEFQIIRWDKPQTGDLIE